MVGAPTATLLAAGQRLQVAAASAVGAETTVHGVQVCVCVGCGVGGWMGWSVGRWGGRVGGWVGGWMRDALDRKGGCLDQRRSLFARVTNLQHTREEVTPARAAVRALEARARGVVVALAISVRA